MFTLTPHSAVAGEVASVELLGQQADERIGEHEEQTDEQERTEHCTNYRESFTHFHLLLLAKRTYFHMLSVIR